MDLPGVIPSGVKYTPPSYSAEYQIFPEEYFSGADVSIYFGDVFVDDITSLSFVLTEMVQPIYGYASYVFDDVARGSRLVQGAFSIAFRESGYLYTILDHIGQLGTRVKPSLAHQALGQSVPQWHARAKQKIEDVLNMYHADPGGTRVPAASYKWPKMSRAQELAGNHNDYYIRKCITELQERLIALGRYNKPPTGFFDDALDAAVKAFQRDMGLPATGVVDSTTTMKLSMATFIPSDNALGAWRPEKAADARFAQYEIDALKGPPDPTKPYFYSGTYMDGLRKTGFDIHIVYGSLADEVKARLNEFPSVVTASSTVKVIRNVQLFKHSQVTDASGRPIEEVYEFIAQDLQ